MSLQTPPDPETPLTPEDLWPAYYEELHSVAVAVSRGEPRSPSLQPTLVLHEAYMKVFGGGVPEWRGKSYLVDRARRRRVERSALSVLPITDIAQASLSEAGRCPERVESLNGAIDALAEVHPRAAAIVEMRVAYDFTNEQLADLVGVAERTVKADWTFARAWLHARLSEGASGDGHGA